MILILIEFVILEQLFYAKSKGNSIEVFPCAKRMLSFINFVHIFFQISSILIIATINRLCKFKKFIRVSGLISDEYFQHIVFLVTYSVFY